MELKLFPHTIICYTDLLSHKIVNEHLKTITAISQINLTEYNIDALTEALSYPYQGSIISTPASSIEELNAIKVKALENHFNLVIISEGVFEGHTVISPKTISNIIIETDLGVIKELGLEKCVIVSDIHGCYESFRNLLLDNKGIKIDKDGKIVVIDETKYVKHILVGDYLDKGKYSEIRKTINLIANNLEHFEIVIGNHEYWVMQYLQGKIETSNVNTELIGKHFQSVLLLMKDEQLRENFYKIYKASYHCIETTFAIITHAPCKNIYLGKQDVESLRNMRMLKMPRISEFSSYADFIKARNENVSFIFEDASQFNKYHIFGHVSSSEVFKYKNKICIDTGCISGGSLTAAIIDESGEITFKHYSETKPYKPETLIKFVETTEEQ